MRMNKPVILKSSTQTCFNTSKAIVIVQSASLETIEASVSFFVFSFCCEVS